MKTLRTCAHLDHVIMVASVQLNMIRLHAIVRARVMRELLVCKILTIVLQTHAVNTHSSALTKYLDIFASVRTGGVEANASKMFLVQTSAQVSRGPMRQVSGHQL